MAGGGFFRGSLLQRTTSDGRGLPKCGRCGFATKCFSPRLPVSGTGSSGVMLVGEAPGEEEDKQGTHFVGEGGQRLRQSLESIGKDIETCWLTYSMICKPTGGGFSDVNIESCRPSLLRTIDELKPKVIVMLGAAPVRSLIPSERGGKVGALDRWAGFSIPSAQHKAWLCPTFSAHQVLKLNEDPAMVLIWNSHLKHAFKLAKKEPRAYTLKELQGQCEVIMSPREGRLRLRDLAKKEGALAFDYEATGLKPDDSRHRLISASFCLDGKDTFALLVNDEDMLKELSPILRSKKLLKVASNMKFEERWTIKKLGHRVANWYWDTMLASHVLDNRGGITSIKFQAFLYLGVPDYNKHVEEYFKSDDEGFNKILDLDIKDLLTYNALDSLLEFMVMKKQRKEMGLE